MRKITEMTDEELALKYVDGDNQAFDELLARNQQKLFDYIMFMVHDQEQANDIFQDTFVKIITKLQQGCYTDSGKFSYWMNRIAHNIIMDRYRMQRSERIVEPNAENDLSNLGGQEVMVSNREMQMVHHQIMKDVRHMMDSLPTAQREVVYMRMYQDLSFKEIAEITGVSINTALGRMRYALLNLRRMAKQHDIFLETTNQHIDTSFHQTWGGFTLHASIDLNQRLASLLCNHPTQPFYLVDGILNEFLSSESGIHTHEQHHLNITDDVLQHRHRCRGIQRHTSLHACIMDFLNGTM